MAVFAVKLSNDLTDLCEADCYQQEGPMTTFFAFGDNRSVIDSWSVRLASYRTQDIVVIRRGSLGSEVGAHKRVELPLSGCV